MNVRLSPTEDMRGFHAYGVPGVSRDGTAWVFIISA